MIRHASPQERKRNGKTVRQSLRNGTPRRFSSDRNRIVNFVEHPRLTAKG